MDFHVAAHVHPLCGAERLPGGDAGLSGRGTVRELIITKGDDQGKDEDFAYDPVEIKKAFNVRKARIEQMQLDAKNVSTKPAVTTTTKKYDWE